MEEKGLQQFGTMANARSAGSHAGYPRNTNTCPPLLLHSLNYNVFLSHLRVFVPVLRVLPTDRRHGLEESM